MRKLISTRNNLLVARNERTLLYETDTETGSSGAPVLNDDWDLVALHHYSEPSLATTDDAGKTVPGHVNEVIRVSAICQELQRGLASRSLPAFRVLFLANFFLFVDEVSNVINLPLIEILSKGAEGGIFATCTMQTLADLAKRLGSEEAARMALSNLNNLIALRTKDRPTQDFVMETFGKTAIHSLRHGLSSGTDGHVGDFSLSYSTQLRESFEEMVPADVLGKLPNLHYFASVSGGRIIKGRFPILDPGTAPSSTTPLEQAA